LWPEEYCGGSSFGADPAKEFKWIQDDDDRALMISNFTCPTDDGTVA